MFAWKPSGRCLLAGLLALCLPACSPWLDSPREDDHPVINEAVARKAMSPREAERLLEKALEANPRLARAHWELGLIRLNNTSNYAAAVYHFQRVLALRPDWPHASTTTQLIAQARIELVRDGVEAPTLPSAKQQLDRYVAEIHRLNASLTNLQEKVRSLIVVTQQVGVENLALRQQLQQAQAQIQAAAQLAANTPAPATPAPVVARSSRPTTAATTNPTAPRSATVARAGSNPRTAASATTNRVVLRGTVSRPPPAASRPSTAAPATARAGGRTHTFRPGDTVAAVAKRYHYTVRDLRNANPGLELGAVRPGQSIRLP